MLQAVDTNPTFAKNEVPGLFRHRNCLRDIQEISDAIDPSKYGGGFESCLLKSPFLKSLNFSWLTLPISINANATLYISVLSGSDIHHFSSELDKVIEKVKYKWDFDFALLKSPIL